MDAVASVAASIAGAKDEEIEGDGEVERDDSSLVLVSDAQSDVWNPLAWSENRQD